VSTLHPGEVSQAVKDLRDAALREMDATPAGESKVDDLKFEYDHEATPPPLEENNDAEGWVAKYPGQNCPHIGNGTGGVRGR